MVLYVHIYIQKEKMADKDEEYGQLNEKLNTLFLNVNKLATNVEQVAEINTATVQVSTMLNNIVKNTNKYKLKEETGQRDTFVDICMYVQQVKYMCLYIERSRINK